MMKRILLATLFAGLTAFSANAQQTLPSGTEIKVRTDTSIPAKPAADSRYSASVSDDVKDASGNVLMNSTSSTAINRDRSLTIGSRLKRRFEEPRSSARIDGHFQTGGVSGGIIFVARKANFLLSLIL